MFQENFKEKNSIEKHCLNVNCLGSKCLLHLIIHKAPPWPGYCKGRLKHQITVGLKDLCCHFLPNHSG